MISFRHSLRFVLVALVLPASAASQTPEAKPKYPFAPRPLGEDREVALALSAAPAEVSSAADVYVQRGTDYVKVKNGTNGCACMVARDLHEGSLYPICFDQEAAKTWLPREIKASSLYARGTPHREVKRLLDEAYGSGELSMPSKPALAYMMSKDQVLFSSPDSTGIRVGAWAPHVMLLLRDVSASQLGLAARSRVNAIQIQHHHDAYSELVVKVPTWSDATPVAH